MKIRDLFNLQPQTFSFEFFPPKTPQDVDDLCCANTRTQSPRAELYFGDLWSRWLNAPQHH